MSKVFFLTTVLVALSPLSGCVIADHIKAQNRMERSQDAYRNCVVANPGDSEKCAALKAFYEEDKAAFEK